MSYINLSQYDEAVSSENLDRSVDEEQQGCNVEIKKTLQRENFWCLLRKNVPSVEKCFSLLQGISPLSSESSNCFQQLYETLTRRNLVESHPSTSRSSAVSPYARISRVNPPKQKLNLNNFFMFLLCACIPVGSCPPPPTQIMVCLPCPPPATTATAFSANSLKQGCEIYPFGVPRKLDTCGPQGSRKGKYLPPPQKRECSERCLHVCDLKAAKPCMAEKGSPCVAHCFESHPRCPSY